jgi:hypothetical protein
LNIADLKYDYPASFSVDYELCSNSKNQATNLRFRPDETRGWTRKKMEEDWQKNHPSIGYFMQLQKKIEQELAEGGSKKEKKNWPLMRRPEVS